MEQNEFEFKEVAITEGQLGNLHDLAMELFTSDDPTNYFYRRQLERPAINWFSVALNCLLPLLAAFALGFGLPLLGVDPWVAITAAIAMPLLWLLINFRRFCICCVKLYQRFAPEAIRRKCRFEPSCSQYMLLSIEKYGVWKGLPKGINRLRRCNINNGGFDEP